MASMHFSRGLPSTGLELTRLVAAQRFLSELGISADALRSRGLKPCVEPEIVEVAEIGVDGREHLLAPQAARAWRAMRAAFLGDGEDIFIVSGFRTVTRQAEIIRRKLTSGQTIAEILRVCAPPGYSEHHSGLAVDVGTRGAPALEPGFDATSAFRWLQKNAGKYGFSLSYPRNNPYGYQYEPWHRCHRAA